jgi:hypothetical protein
MEDTMPDTTEDGAAAARLNRFGPEPHQVMPGEWADIMLTQLATQNAALFGRLLLAASLSRNGKAFEVTRPGRPASNGS